MKKYEFDVVLTFAGEDSAYVESVAKFLADADINFLYNSDFQIELWGKNLYSYLQDVYENKAEFCVIFISQYYKQKWLTRPECKNMLEWLLREDNERVLPVRFDNTAIPGIKNRIKYIHLNTISPQNLAQTIIKKVKERNHLKGPARQITSSAFTDQKVKHPESFAQRLRQYEHEVMLYRRLEK
ncbi:MAG: TIR domain-containing protein [Negativicutes bacterium]|nr:TIR domain-containing protein [Negativicutes bacterium]